MWSGKQTLLKSKRAPFRCDPLVSPPTIWAAMSHLRVRLLRPPLIAGPWNGEAIWRIAVREVLACVSPGGSRVPLKRSALVPLHYLLA